MRRIRVLLVDDNDDFVDGVVDWLAGEEGIEIVGTASSGRQAIEQVARLRPDLVLTDGTMPEMDGFEATRRIKSRPDAPWVVLMTFHDGAAVRDEAWAAGADGFITKSEVTNRLMGVIEELVANPSDKDRRPSASRAPRDAESPGLSRKKDRPPDP